VKKITVLAFDKTAASTFVSPLDIFNQAGIQRYPHIDIKPERMITDEGDLFCSAGFSAGIDLSLYLVEKYCGREVALQCAKGMLYDTGRSSQAPYNVSPARPSRNREKTPRRNPENI
jgi:transcriptional regulator GlxA family with amidase domain